MKKTILLCAMTIASIAANAQNDTLTVVRPDSVTIIRGNDKVNVNIYGDGKSRDYRYSMSFALDNNEPMVTKEKSTSLKDFSLPLFGDDKNADGNRRWRVHGDMVPGLLWSWTYASGAPADVEIAPFSSINIWLPALCSFSVDNPADNLRFSFAWGLEWRNYRMKDDKRFFLDDKKVVNVVDYPDNAKADFSRLKVLSHTFSLTARLKMFDDFYLRFGPVLSLNSGLSVLTKYKDGDNKKVREKQNDPKVNNVSVEYMADLQYSDFGFFVKYSPRNVMRQGYGPQFSTTTVGVSICW